MSFPHEVIAALPTVNPADKELLRDMCTRRFAYCLADDEAASDFVAKDPVSSIPPLNLIQGGTLFAYDETDTTTSASAVCLVTNDACRYKSGVVEPPYSVLTYSTIAQPADVDVSDGDTFLLPIGATGADWAGKAGQIAMRVGAKWHFAISPIGRKLYVEDEDTFYYRNDSGVWTAGNGANEFAANSIPITAIIGAKASFVIKVENQTTNAPPASPVAPVAYIIGSSPTGAWAGLAGQLAACLVDGSYAIIVPEEGDEVWDKALNNKVRFNGTAWVSAAGAVLAVKTAGTRPDVDQTRTGTTSSYYTVDTEVAPTKTNLGIDDDLTITHTASRVGAQLLFEYKATIEPNSISPSDGTRYPTGLFRGSETNAIAWDYSLANGLSRVVVFSRFFITADDTSEHFYRMRVLDPSLNGRILALSYRTFSLTELA